MKMIPSRLFLSFILICPAWLGLLAQDPPQQDEMPDMAAAMALAQPGPEHEILQGLAGEWRQEVKMWMQPGQEPIVSQGGASAKMVLGGRFLQTNGEIGEPPMRFTSMWMIGFDRRHKKFTMVGFDTMGTYYITAAGTYDEATKTLTCYGEDEDPVMGFTQKYDIIFKILGPDKYVTEVIFKDYPGVAEKEYKMLEIVSTRE